MGHFNLYQLPNELIIHMAGFLRPLEAPAQQAYQTYNLPADEEIRQQENTLRRNTLHALCLTSWKLNAIYTPLLYSTVSSSASYRGLDFVVKFLATVEKRRDLAEHVEDVENQLSDDLNNYYVCHDSIDGPEELKSLYFKALVQLLSRTPNVQKLSLITSEVPDTSLVSDLLHGNLSEDVGPNHGFRRLRSLQFRSAPPGDIYPANPYLIATAASKFPELRELRISGLDNGLSMPIGSQLSTVTRLSLMDIEVTDASLSSLLESCSALEHFACHSTIWSYETEQSQRFSSALARHRQTLKSLSLVHLYGLYPAPQNAVLEYTTLPDMHHLEEATLCRSHFPILSDPDHQVDVASALSARIPPSLKRLRIILCPHDLLTTAHMAASFPDTLFDASSPLSISSSSSSSLKELQILLTNRLMYDTPDARAFKSSNAADFLLPPEVEQNVVSLTNRFKQLGIGMVVCEPSGGNYAWNHC